MTASIAAHYEARRDNEIKKAQAPYTNENAGRKHFWRRANEMQDCATLDRWLNSLIFEVTSKGW